MRLLGHRKTPEEHAYAIWDAATEQLTTHIEVKIGTKTKIITVEHDAQSRELIVVRYPIGPNDGRFFTPALLYWIMRIEKDHPTGRVLQLKQTCFPTLEFEWREDEVAVEG